MSDETAVLNGIKFWVLQGVLGMNDSGEWKVLESLADERGMGEVEMRNGSSFSSCPIFAARLGQGGRS
jgi:hypothetical protein